jgi:hypothetical protein
MHMLEGNYKVDGKKTNVHVLKCGAGCKRSPGGIGLTGIYERLTSRKLCKLESF